MARSVDFLRDIHPRYHEWNFIRNKDIGGVVEEQPQGDDARRLTLQDSKGDSLNVGLSRSLLKRWGGVLGEFK
ncbi:hypothetical protein PIB30_032311 [Stylosanthes scabra]|uniref:Uncharacterized protein n=1 Tax=Stylosanthes scabra TaxID=79078 RepID=A0ABU6QCP3_9FABA|nr:hypothetical protein [Stylosanthes scabra]